MTLYTLFFEQIKYKNVGGGRFDDDKRLLSQERKIKKKKSNKKIIRTRGMCFSCDLWT